VRIYPSGEGGHETRWTDYGKYRRGSLYERRARVYLYLLNTLDYENNGTYRPFNGGASSPTCLPFSVCVCVRSCRSFGLRHRRRRSTRKAYKLRDLFDGTVFSAPLYVREGFFRLHREHFFPEQRTTTGPDNPVAPAGDYKNFVSSNYRGAKGIYLVSVVRVTGGV